MHQTVEEGKHFLFARQEFCLQRVARRLRFCLNTNSAPVAGNFRTKARE